MPEAYYQFVMDYAPYVYVIPPDAPDPAFGRAAFAAAFTIDFLYEAYSFKQFESRKTEVYNKIVSLADWILTQQCTDPAKKAYGGFKSNETSTYYYSVDACRVIPSLLKAYELTNDTDYLNTAKLAEATFLKTMQDQQAYGGFARAVTIAETLHQLGFNTQLFGSEKYSLSKLQTLNYKQVARIREAFIKNSHARFMKYFFPHQLFGKREAYTNEIRETNLERLAHLIKVCGFLMQTKVYLFSKVSQKECICLLGDVALSVYSKPPL